MTPESVDAMIERYGQTVTLKRAGEADLALRAKVRFYRPAELVGGIQQGDREVIMGTAALAAVGWPVPPKRGDQIVADGRTMTVQSVEPRHIGDAVAGYWLQVRG